MAAGDSASERERRHAENRRQLADQRVVMVARHTAEREQLAQRQAAETDELDRRAASQQRQERNWSQGSAGERAVGKVLAGIGREGWYVLHDRRRTPVSPANIDHIAVGPAGLVVIDAKNWSGRVTLSAEGELRQNGFCRVDEVEAVAADARQLSQELLGLAPARAVICFVNDIGIGAPVLTASGTTLLSLDHLAGWLRSLPAADMPSPLALAGELNLLHPPRSEPARPSRAAGRPRQNVPSTLPAVAAGRSRAAPTNPPPAAPPRPAPVPRRRSRHRAASGSSGIPRRVLGALALVLAVGVTLAVLPRLVAAGVQRLSAPALQTAAQQSGLTGGALGSFCSQLAATSRSTPEPVTATPASSPGTCTVRTAAGAAGFVREGAQAGAAWSGASSGQAARAACGTGWYESGFASTAGTAHVWSDEVTSVPVAACVRSATPAAVLQLVHTARRALV